MGGKSSKLKIKKNKSEEGENGEEQTQEQTTEQKEGDTTEKKPEENGATVKEVLYKSFVLIIEYNQIKSKELFYLLFQLFEK